MTGAARAHQAIPRWAYKAISANTASPVRAGHDAGLPRLASMTVAAPRDMKNAAPAKVRSVVGCHSVTRSVTLGLVARPRA